ncbi:MAG TPA: tetratricopeptide repeat protein, partial [Phenylobacterium sp.]|jgi:tetratricopeptide (TPR) repeat protein|nr:tetratricopeptide repeat protein [Phenylobacterium sp.]
MADFDQALKLKPEDPVSLIGRGELYLASRDLGHAKTDFDAALRADPNRMPQVAAFYVATGNFEPAIAGYDAWIEAHPKSDNLYAAFNARCRARTMWNHDLDKALADCEAAMHRGPRAAALFETRGLTHLRRGELDLALADYNEALKLQPRLAWALYGRGLAKIGKGDKAGGEADLQAAATIAPNLAAQAKRFGLAPPGATVQAAAAGG